MNPGPSTGTGVHGDQDVGDVPETDVSEAQQGAGVDAGDAGDQAGDLAQNRAQELVRGRDGAEHRAEHAAGDVVQVAVGDLTGLDLSGGVLAHEGYFLSWGRRL